MFCKICLKYNPVFVFGKTESSNFKRDALQEHHTSKTHLQSIEYMVSSDRLKSIIIKNLEK